MIRNTPLYLLLTLLPLALFSIMAALTFGAVEVPFSQVVSVAFSSQNDALAEQVIWQLRMPRTLLAFIAGGGLALAGLMLQTVTRNPLADPYLFGISSGAAVGVVLFITLVNLGSVLATNVSLSVAAMLGGMTSMFLLIAISGSALGRQVESMLLAGVALSFLFSAITSLLLYWSDPQAISAVLFWTMGSFSRAQWPQLILPMALLTLVLLSLMAFRRQLSAILLGDETAITLGVNVHRFRLSILILSSLLTASLVSVCGGIGFVGLMIPHLVRLFISQSHPLMPALVTLLGGVFMVWVDVFSRTLLENQELPIGIITGLMGSLFFLVLMAVRQRQQGF